ncbi:replication endonuclease [Thiothrix nivea]|uniref:Replication protein A n=1 Tax=Thiothrix nivea (strain ATCC 35100 / DSM 5205 / JP2) TaxID=870187 RepID=A0A656HHL9_THINJ|nr:replication endonuclease [Thiothrix nivea]EIJ34709.1 replication protein A [Thiothrix nivea DSM 5205]
MMQPTMHHHPQDGGFIASQLAQLPEGYHQQIGREYSHRYQTAGQHDGERRRNANLFMLDLTGQAGGRVFTLSDEEIRRKADRLALECRRLMKLAGDQDKAVTVGLGFFQSAGFDPQGMAGFDATGITARLADPQYWKRKLLRRQDREQEAFAIRLGVVHRGRGLYVSDAMFNTVQTRIASSIKALAALEAVNEETGETVDMLTVMKGSVANPEVRRVELMVRMRGFEEAAKQAGHVGTFYTITCPSKFHRFTTDENGKPADNPNYQGATPRDGQTYLNAIWRRIRAKLKRDGLTAYGFRVAEPHHDGCPHWHLLLFTPPHQCKAVTAILRAYTMQEDGSEAGAAKYRFKAVEIDASKGSATGYIAKYVSKNINGYGVDEDFEGGIDAADSAQRVRAWASLWGIRQFQQCGGAPVGVWRELRRLQTAPDGLLEEARQAADAGDWCAYLQLQGGVSALRKEQPLRVYTVERVDTATGEVISNKYGEITGKVEGVDLLGMAQVQTRLHVWRIQAKANQPQPETAFDQAHYVDGFDILTPATPAPMPVSGIRFPASSSGAAAPPRSPVNNCTQPWQEGQVWGVQP